MEQSISKAGRHGVCLISDIRALEETKTYTIFANPILKSLLIAVKDGLISHKAALAWIMLKSESQAADRQEWMIKKSIRDFAVSMGMSKNSAQKVYSELEHGGFIEVDRSQRQDLRTDANTIKVRFPVEGIELAKLERDRSKMVGQGATQSTINPSLSTEVGQNQGHACTQIRDSIKNRTINKKLSNNNTDTLSTNQATPSESSVNCCVASPKTKENEISETASDPILEAMVALQARIEKLGSRAAELTAMRQKEVGNRDAYLEWLEVDSRLQAAKVQLEGLQVPKRKPRAVEQEINLKLAEKPDVAQGKGSKLTAPVELAPALEKKIERIGYKIAKEKQWSDPSDMIEQVKYMAANFAIGKTPEHCANICFKLIAEDRFETPGGYVSNNRILRDEERKQKDRVLKQMSMIRHSSSEFHIAQMLAHSSL